MSEEAAERPYVYRIDASNTITYVSTNWPHFAHQNGASSLTESAVVGQPLLQNIAGRETRLIYRDLIEEVRTGRTLTVPFRCDAPGFRRAMQLRMRPLDGGGVEFESQVLRVDSRDPGLFMVLDPSAPRGGALIVMCSWCKRVQDPQGEWLDLERAVQVGQLLCTPDPPGISHGICASCCATVKIALEDSLAVSV